MVARSGADGADRAGRWPASAAGASRGCRPRFIPIEDQGYLMVAVQLPDGASLERTQQRAGRGHARSRSRRRACDQVVAIAGISVLDNSATLANAGVAYVILKDWSERGKATGQDLRSHLPHICKAQLDKLPDGRRLSCSCRRRSRASAMPAASPCRSSCATAASTISKLQSIDADAIVEDGNTQSGLQRAHSTFRAGVPQLRVTVDRVEGGDAERLGRRRVRRAVVLYRLELRQPVQQVRPHVPGLCAGRLAVPAAARRHREAVRAQPGRQDGAARRAGRRSSRWSGRR